MFPKCSLEVSNIETLREHTVNIPGIFRAGWVFFVIIDTLKEVKTKQKQIENFKASSK